MKVEKLIKLLSVDFYTGVPDSQLSPLCNYLMNQYGTDPRHHIIAANEGNAVALAAGYHLATGKVPIVYMQNSGEGNAVNPVASLLNQNVYGIPLFLSLAGVASRECRMNHSMFFRERLPADFWKLWILPILL